MAVNLGLLQALGDPFNDPVDTTRTEIPDPRPDPLIVRMLQSDSVDSEMKARLRTSEKNRLRTERIRTRLARLRQKDEAQEDDGLVSFLGPVPIGFQFGTAAGIENGFLRFAVDVLVDPVNLVSGIGVLNKLGRASKFLKGLSATDKAKTIARGARSMARIGLDKELGEQAAKAADEFDFKTLKAIFKKTSKKKLSATEITSLEKEMGADAGDFIKLLKNENKEVRGLRAAFELQDKGKKLDLATGFVNQIRQGQRGLINFGIPFSDKEFGTLSFGKVLGGLEDAKTVAKEAIDLKTTGLLDPADASKMHFGQGIDITNSAQVEKGLINAVDKTIDGVSGKATADALGTDDWAETGRDVVEVLKGEQNFATQNANEIGAYTDFMTKGSKKVKLAISEILDNPKADFSVKQFPVVKPSKLTEEALVKADPRFKSLPQAAQKLTLEIQRLFRGLGTQAISAEVFRDLWHNYMTRIVKIKSSSGAQEVSRILDRLSSEVSSFGRRGTDVPGNKFGLRRVFDTMEELKEFAAKNPKSVELVTEDLSEVLQTYVGSMGQAIVRNRAIKVLRDMRTVEGLPYAITKANAEDVLKQGGAITKALNIGGREVKAGARLTKDQIFEVQKHYGEIQSDIFKETLVHNDVAPQVQAIFDKNMLVDLTKDPSRAWQKGLASLDYANKLGKASLFNLNPFFHTVALIFSQFAILPPGAAVKNVIDAGKFFSLRTDPLKASEVLMQMMSRSVKVPGRGSVNATDLMDLFKVSNVKTGRAMLEAQEGFGAVEELTDFFINSVKQGDMITKPLELGAKGLQHWNQLTDRNLWLVFQNTFKVNTWSHIMAAEMQRAAKLNGSIPKGAGLLRMSAEAGNITNQAFGGLAWESLGATQTMRNIGRWFFLAPDWTTSNLLMARDMFLNMPGVKNLAGPITRDVLLSDMRFRWAMGYNMRAAFYATMGSNLANFAFTKYRTGKGRWLWENDKESFDESTGFNSRIELPYVTNEGRRQFMDIFKQFSEPMKLARQPLKFYEGKMGVVPRIFKTAIVGTDAFGRKINGGEGGPYSQIMARTFSLTGQFAPIPLQSTVQSLTGKRDPRSTAISTFGFSIRSEDKRNFERRQKEQELRKQLKAASSVSGPR